MMENTVAFVGVLILLAVAVGALLFGYIADEEAMGRWHDAVEDWPFAEAGVPVPAPA